MLSYQTMTGIGIIVIFIGVFLVLFGTLKSSDSSNTKVAVGGFIGFIPFGFSNDKRLLWGILALTAIIMVLWFLAKLRISNP